MKYINIFKSHKQHFSKTFLTFVVSMMVVCTVQSQVTAVDYFIKYNPSTCWFDCCLIVGEGSATTIQQRNQASAQYSVVIPYGSKLEIKRFNMPLQSNQTYGGKFPTEWIIGSVVEGPASAPNSTFYSISPSLSPSAFYNNLKKGDTVVLFSIDVSNLKQCGKGVRLFDNQKDPKSEDPGMNGGNFKNGTTMGSTIQRYRGNVKEKGPDGPVIQDLEILCGNGIEISANAISTHCKDGLTYTWSGPAGYSGSDKYVTIPTAGANHQGYYQLTVTDAIGCSASAKIYTSPKSVFQQNHVVQCFKTGSVTLMGRSEGNWTVSGQSPGSASFDRTNSDIAVVSNFSKDGLYKIIHEIDKCKDTFNILVKNECQCNLSNILNQAEDNQYCGVASGYISGSALEGSLYTWEISRDNITFQAATGVKTTKDYNFNLLAPGRYYFRRIAHRESQCSDTSNTVTYIVHPGVSAGDDVVLDCYKNDQLQLNGSFDGTWSVDHPFWGDFVSKYATKPNITMSGFASPDDLMFIRANDFCADTAYVTILDNCDCLGSGTSRTMDACQNEIAILKSNCTIGKWVYEGAESQKFTIVKDSAGSASVKILNYTSGKLLFRYMIEGKTFETIELLLHPKPFIALGDDIEFCEDSKPLLLAASGGVRYLWPDGNTSAVMRPSLSVGQRISVIGYNQWGCSDTDTIFLIMHPKPKGTIVKNVKAEESTYFTLDPGNWANAVSYEWFGPKNFYSKLKKPVIPNIRKDQAGTYYVIVNSPYTCETIASVIVEVINGPRSDNFEKIVGQRNQSTRSNIIHWEIDEKEPEYKYYYLERSSDGVEFEDLALLDHKKAGSKDINIYTWNDAEALEIGDYFYRVRKVLKSGAYNYSDKAKISLENIESKLDFVLYPNPSSSDKTHFMSLKPIDELTTVEIYDIHSRVIARKIFNALNSEDNVLTKMNINELAKGTYFIHVKTNTETQTLKWIVTD